MNIKTLNKFQNIPEKIRKISKPFEPFQPIQDVKFSSSVNNGDRLVFKALAPQVFYCCYGPVLFSCYMTVSHMTVT